MPSPEDRHDRAAIRYVGMLRSVASWAKVGRELINALQAIDVHVCVDEHQDDRFDPTFPLRPRTSEADSRICSIDDEQHVTVTFASPSDYPQLPLGPASIGLLAWEATEWPTSWVTSALDHVSRIVVPATYPAQTLAASGYPSDRIGVVPHGVDHTRYSPGTRRPPGSGERVKLLFVGTAARRKGLDILISAISLAIPAGSIELVVKMVPYADAQRRRYLDQSWRAALGNLKAQGHPIRIVEDVVSEEDMAELYRNADLLCHPFRGECFPLPFLEAMACGTPVLCTSWSGPLDLLDDSVALLVPPAVHPPAAPMLPEPELVSTTATMVAPDVEAVAALLRKVVAQPTLLTSLGQRARARTLSWTWEAAAGRLIDEADIVRRRGRPDRSSLT